MVAVASIIIVLVLGIAVTVVVGRALQGLGQPFLEDVFSDQRVSDSVARLLSVLFYLLALGVVALVGTMNLSSMNWLYATSAKLGVVLLVLGVVHGGTLLALLRIKKRRRHQMVEENIAARAATGRRERSRSRLRQDVAGPARGTDGA
jgi:hypothetical protein